MGIPFLNLQKNFLAARMDWAEVPPDQCFRTVLGVKADSDSTRYSYPAARMAAPWRPQPPGDSPGTGTTSAARPPPEQSTNRADGATHQPDFPHSPQPQK